jgi:hypothetical protein
MVVAIGLDGVVQLVQKVQAVAGEEIGTADSSLLQAFVREEGLGEGFGVTADDFAFL